MPYRDTWATCEECGKQYVFTVEEQRRLDKMGLEVEPSGCPECREGQTTDTMKSVKSVESVESVESLQEGEQVGVVKWYEPRKRYGFITMRTGDDIFFHKNAIAEGRERDFDEGVRVTFTLSESDKGPEASEVKLAQ